MSTGQWAVVLRHVRRLFEGGGVSGLSEGQLLERFAASRATRPPSPRSSPATGRWSLGSAEVCSTIPNDVDDAFQATFLVLVKQSRGAPRWRPARPVALRRRPQAFPSAPAPTRPAERPEKPARVRASRLTAPPATLDAELRELQSLIREEVDRLSTNDRMAVVLCYLEGLTHEEAADRLGWPIGTVKGPALPRARDKLKATA